MHGVAPKVIIIDQDAQIGDTIKMVFSTTRHRYSFWHVRKHIAEQQIPMTKSMEKIWSLNSIIGTPPVI